MKMNEIEMNIFNVPQGYYLAQGISKDLDFSVGLPAQFNKVYNMSEKLEAIADDYAEYELEIEVGEVVIMDNVFNLVVKETSYDKPNRGAFIDALREMCDLAEYLGIKKIAIPRICCGQNGFKWEQVKTLIKFIFEDSDIKILVCKQ